MKKLTLIISIIFLCSPIWAIDHINPQVKKERIAINKTTKYTPINKKDKNSNNTFTAYLNRYPVNK